MSSGGPYGDEDAQQRRQEPEAPPPPAIPPCPAEAPAGAEAGGSEARAGDEESALSPPEDRVPEDGVPEEREPEEREPEDWAPEDRVPGQAAEDGDEADDADEVSANSGAERAWWEDRAADAPSAGPDWAADGKDGVPPRPTVAPPTAPDVSEARGPIPPPPATAPDWGAPGGPGAQAPPPPAELPTQSAQPPPPTAPGWGPEPAPGVLPPPRDVPTHPAPGYPAAQGQEQAQEQPYGYGQDASYDPYAAPYAPYPGYELGVEPERPRRRGGVIAAVVGLVVIVAGGLIAGGWLLLGGDDDGEQAAEPRRSAAADPKSPKEEPSPSSEPSAPSPSSSEPEVPPGYVLASENGYSLAVPEDWERRVDGVSVFYEEPVAGGAFIQVYEVTEQVSPYEAVQIIEATKENAEGYRLNEMADLGHSAEYDYSYIDEDLGPRRVLLHDRETEDGKMYALLASGPETAWPQQREVVDEMAVSFCAGTECGAEATGGA
ncbi:hypothetical protein [Streptomyces sp. CNQ-509]|uniref:hypothetical protein n=1 Tax=Streptomyces sp. CNQ-509 TaxID=444103 RepID=UPI000A9942BA|nr:hypothetical protein [Streptomyces sp. CNQ-509]